MAVHRRVITPEEYDALRTLLKATMKERGISPTEAAEDMDVSWMHLYEELTRHHRPGLLFKLLVYVAERAA